MDFRVLLVFLLFLSSTTTFAQVTLFQFNFETNTNVTTNNTIAPAPTFTSNGTANDALNNNSPCQGTNMRYATNWSTGDYHRFTVNTTGFNNMTFSFCDRTNNTDIGTFIVRVSSDAGATWTTVLNTYTPTTANTTRTTGTFPVEANNNPQVWIEIYKTNNSNNNNRQFRIDQATLSGLTIPTFIPANGCSGSNQLVTITGSNFTAASTVSFNGTLATSTFISATQLTAILPTSATTGQISVTTPSIGTSTSIRNFVINPIPTAVTAAASATAICSGGTIDLTSSATSNSNTATTLLNETFNGTPTGWTTTNNSSGGNTGNAAWTLRADNHLGIRSNDQSQFYISNSDAQGTGGTTNTTLVSPVFSTMGISSANLSFWHYYRYWDGGETIYADISTDGGTTWANLQTHNGSNIGTATNFTNTTISINGYLNQPNVQIRFRYQATYDYYWAIDNVSVSATPATPAISYAWTSNPTGFTSSDQNPTGVTPAGDTTYTVRVTNNYGCWAEATANVTVTPVQTVGIPSSSPVLCVNTPLLTNITHTTSGATGIGTATGLPNGVSAIWASDTLTISGTPTQDGTFNYSIPLTGGCGTVNATGTIIVNPDNLSVSTASATPTLCNNTALVSSITHTTTNATGIQNDGVSGANGLPAGISATWSSNTITISGTPTVDGVFNYSIPLIGGCGNVNATGTITVTLNSTVSVASSIPTLCVNTTLPNTTHVTTIATGIGTPAGLPPGVIANWTSDTITINGTPTLAGVYNYTIPVTGCGTANATGIITVEDPVAAAGIITGTATACQGQTGVIYSVPTITNATSYTWTLPAGATLVSGANTNSITVDFSISAISGNVSVYGANSCGNGISADFAVTVNPLPGTGTIIGTAIVCQGQTGIVYSVPAITDAIDYFWNLPAGATITSGTNTNSITVDFSTSATSGNITVYATNLCGAGAISANYAVTVTTLSVAPTSISGTSTICEGTSTTLTLVGGTQGTGATAEWFTDSCDGTSAGIGNTITVSPTITTTYYVRYNGGCNTTTCASVTVTVDPLPVAAGTISGTTTICQGQNNITYTVPIIANATSYVWTVPSGATYTQTANSITVNYGVTATSGNVSVRGNNTCGNGILANFAVTVNPLPSAAGTITGTATVCQGQTGIVYTVPTIANADNYTWTLPTGITITSGANTNSITVNFSTSATSGNITVQGNNSCGNGVISASYSITTNVPSVTPTSINIGSTPICEGTSTTLTLVGGTQGTGAIAEWFSGSCGGTSAGTGNSITVSPTTTTTYYVRYNGTCNTTACTSVTVTVNPLPVASGIISGPTAVCQGETHTYTVPIIANATNYVWTIPNNATIISGDGTNSIIVDFDITAVSGNITVYGQNACGTGATSLLGITVSTSPYIVNNYTTEICSGQTTTISPVNGVDGNIIPLATTYSWGLPISSGGIAGATANSNQSSFSQTLTNTTGITQTAIYTVTASTNGCSSSTFNVSIFVNPKPTVAINSTSPICSGEEIDLTPSNPNSISGSIDYNWTRTDGNANIIGLNSGNGSIFGNLYNTTNTQQTVIFAITATSDIGGCLSDFPATVNVTVNPMPTLTAPSSICRGNTATLTSTVTGGTWTSSNTDIATITNAGFVTPTGLFFGAVTFTYTTTANCSDSRTVNIYDAPMATAPATICQGSTVILSPTNGGTWTSSNNTIATITNAGVVTPGTTGDVTFTFTNINGCSSTTNTVQILTAPPSINSVTASNNPVCSGNPSILTVDVAGILGAPVTLANYLFNNNTNNSANVTNVTCNFTTDLNTSYTANNNGTTTTADAFTTNVANRGLIQTDNQGNNDAGYWQFNLTGIAVQNYRSFRVYFQAKREVANQGNKTIIVEYATNGGAYTYLGTVNLNNNTTTWQTGLFSLPAVTNNPTSLQIRLNVSDGYTGNSGNSSNHPHVTIDNFQIQGATVANPTLYSWTANTGANSGLPTNAETPLNNNDKITVNPEVTTTYTTTATNTAGCSSTATVTVNVYPTPNITITADYCPTDNPATTQNEANMVLLTASCSNATINNWLWSNGATTSSIYVDVADFYQVIGTSTNGCPGSASINVSQELVVNGDFTQGNVGFTSDYAYHADVAGNNELVDDSGNNGYSVTTNGQNVHNNFHGTDHTNGSGNFMAVNGHGSNLIVWKQTINVEANTDYYFAAYARSLNDVNPYGKLRFRVNGVQVGTQLNLGSYPTYNWDRFYGMWNSGAVSGAILIEIINNENAAGGNDFGIDDISFGTLSTFITLTSAVGTDAQTVCQNSPITNITYDIGGGLTPPVITGLPSGLTTIYNGLIYTISGTPTQYGIFNYTIQTGSDCGEPKTVSGILTVHQAPTAIITPVAAAICRSDNFVTVSATFGGSATGGTWSGGAGTFDTVVTTGNIVTANYNFGISENSGTVTLTFTANAPIGSVCTNYTTTIPIRINRITPGTIVIPTAFQTTFCVSSHAAISLNASPITGAGVSGDLSYQWQSSTIDCNNGFSDITVNGNNEDYTIPANTLTQTTYFRRIATSTLNGVSCSAYSNCITLTSNNVTAAIIEEDQVICRNENPEAIEITTLATGDGTITYQWYRNCTSSVILTGETNTIYTPPVLTTTTSYIVRATSTLNGRACPVNSNCVTITVNPLVSPGTISANRTICEGDIPTALTGSGIADSYQWQSSTDGLNFNAIIGATSSSYAPGATYQTTYYRRIAVSNVNGINCSSVPSNTITITVNTITAPVIAVNGNSTFCGSINPDEFTIVTPATSSGTLTYLWQYKTASDCSVNTGWINITGATAATYNPALISQTTYYRVRVRVNGMCDVFSNCIEITALGKTWNGSAGSDWDNPANWTPIGVPTATNCVTIPNVTNDPIIQGTNYNAYAMNVSVLSGGNLTINGSNTLIATDFVNTAGAFTINNNASLVQINDVANTGNIVYNRTATGIKGHDYVYWSSPVDGQTVNSIYTTPTSGPKYRWNTTLNNGNGNFGNISQGNWEGASGIMTRGRGYIIRGSNNANSAATNINATFTGIPHNGTIPYTVSRGVYIGIPYAGLNGSQVTNLDDNFNLLGNPYPSAINALEFLAVNAQYPGNPSGTLMGSIDLWTHGTDPSSSIADPFYGSFVYNYDGNDYVTINYLGGSTAADLGDLIRSGQAFFVKMADGTTGNGQVNFTNAMRLDASGNPYNNANFFRTTENSGATERHRIWIDLVNANSLASGTLVGYATNAEDGFDTFFDARTAIPNYMKIYSLIDNDIDVYNIQGKKFPFSQDDRIKLGIKITQAGNYTIALNTIDGIFLDQNQNIFLEDKMMNVIHNLKETPYAFTTNIGSFNDRFEIVYQGEALGTNNPEANTVAAFVSNDILYVNATKNIQEIILFDMAGKKLTTFSNDIPVNTFKTEFNYPNGVYLAKVKMDDNTIVNIKIGN